MLTPILSFSLKLNNINKLTGKNIKAKHDPERLGDIKHSLADISKAEKLLGYKPSVSFEEGLKKTIEWFKQ